MNADQILAAVLLLAAKAAGESLDGTILLFEQAGLVDHTYVARDGRVDIEYRFTPMAKALLKDVEKEIQ